VQEIVAQVKQPGSTGKELMIKLNEELVRVARDAIAKERARDYSESHPLPTVAQIEWNVEVNATAFVYNYCCEQDRLEELNPALEVEQLADQIGDMVPYLAAIRALVKQCMKQE
jgi:hypothetical protein